MPPSAVSAWVAPEATQRAAHPIGHAWDTRDERAVKGEVPERQGEAVRSRPRKEEVSGADQGGEESTNSRSFWREEPDWNHKPSQSQSGMEITAPGSRHLGPATLQEKRGQARSAQRSAREFKSDSGVSPDVLRWFDLSQGPAGGRLLQQARGLLAVGRDLLRSAARIGAGSQQRRADTSVSVSDGLAGRRGPAEYVRLPRLRVGVDSFRRSPFFFFF
ncbi:hypothetical protein NDU88_001623 [Pleurodeles waltl]|uniref:Uncharacterized protein n=1 Tax=Pleurodeles waltl TaxID=8319 RepID=A0AAV7MKA0_PLEWA|nr:hypothetical protein NDU88_001623 [Pleurodeles waltl]